MKVSLNSKSVNVKFYDFRRNKSLISRLKCVWIERTVPNNNNNDDEEEEDDETELVNNVEQPCGIKMHV